MPITVHSMFILPDLLVTFNHSAAELTPGWLTATPDNVTRLVHRVEGLQSSGRTNLYAGLERTLKGLDDDRATRIVLVSDGVTDTSVIEPAQFQALMQRPDVFARRMAAHVL